MNINLDEDNASNDNRTIFWNENVLKVILEHEVIILSKFIQAILFELNNVTGKVECVINLTSNFAELTPVIVLKFSEIVDFFYYYEKNAPVYIENYKLIYIESEGVFYFSFDPDDSIVDAISENDGALIKAKSISLEVKEVISS